MSMPQVPSLAGPPWPHEGRGEARPCGAPDGRFRALADALPNLAFETDVGGANLWISAAWERYTGLPGPRLLGQGWQQVLHPEDLAAHEAERQQRLGAGTAFSLRLRIRRHDGQWRWHLVHVAPSHDGAGALGGWVGSATDVDEMVRAEQALAAQEQRTGFMLALNEALRDLAEPQDMMDAATAALGQQLGVAQVGYAEIDAAQQHLTVHRDWNDGRIPSVAGTWRMDDFGPAFIESLKAGQTVAIADVTQDGRTAAPAVVVAYEGINARSLLDVPLVKQGRLVAMLFIHHPQPRGWSEAEVTLVERVCERLWAAVERARAERARDASEAHLSAVLDALPVGVVLSDTSGRLLRDNAAFRALWGAGPDTGSWEQYGDWVAWHGDSGERVQAHEWALTRALLYGEVVHGQPLQCQPFGGGPRRFFLNNAAPVRDAQGRLVGGVAVTVDVTAQREAELERERLLAAEHAARAQMEAMLGAISDAFYALDHEWRFSYVNDRALALLGVTREELLGRVVWEAYAPVLGTHLEREFRRAMAQGVPVAFENHYPPLGMWFDVRAFPSPQGLAVYFQDITARREAAERLRASEELLQAIFDAAPVGVVVAEAPSGRIVKSNRQVERILGHPVMATDGVQDYGAYAAFHPDGTPLRPDEHVMARALAGEPRPEMELLYQRPDGYRAWIRAVGAPIRGGDGALTGALVVLDDIDDKRRALESLQERTRQLAQAQLRLDMALAAGRMGVWDWSPHTGESHWNREMFELLGLPPQPEGMVPNEVFLSRVHPEDRAALKSALARALHGCGSFELEMRLAGADGRPRWVLGRGQAVGEGPGRVERLVGVNLDITAQKTAQAALSEALQSKEVLLYEVHHRVKNNLQIISSLLSLQLRSVRDADARRAIEQASARVGVMARLHLELYQSGRHGDLDLAPWLHRLGQDTLRLLGQGRPIALDFHADVTLTLPVDQAVPLSLMVSELLTNALKYAFPAGRAGTVRLQVHRAQGGVQVLVADDGVGLPPQLEPESGGGLGLRIVHALARQIDARLELLERRAGVAFRIGLPLAEAAGG